MNHFFKELFQYNHHCNQNLAELIIYQKDNISDKTLSLFSHILNAQHIWNHRITGKPAQHKVWDVHLPELLKQLNEENYRETMFILDNTNPDKKIAYSNTKGEHFTNTASDILFHVINHSTYHRGQIASDMKQHGIEPVKTDYIFYKR